MTKRWFRDSLIAQMGLMMGGITLLAVLSMISSVIIAEASRGSAAAINLAGSLRMQSYRIATRLLDEPGQDGTTRAARVDTEIREFERRLRSPEITDAIPRNPRAERRQAYEHVVRLWEGEIRTLLARMETGNTPATGPPPVPRLHQLDRFVDQLDRLVGLLEQGAEANILLLRLIQGSALFLTLALVFATMYQLHTAVVGPLRDLVGLAHQVRHGDLTARARHLGDDELGVLGQAFNLMAEDLSKSYAGLESRVEEKTQALRSSNRSLELLYNTTRRLNEADLEETTFGALLQEIEKLTGTGTTRICLTPSPDGREARTFCAHPAGTTTPASPSGTEAVPLAPDNTLSVPIRDQEQHFGELLVYEPPAELASGWQLELLQAVAQHIAVALRASELAERNRRLSLLEERNVIARELHDSLAQALSFLKLKVGHLQALLAKNGPVADVHPVVQDLREGLNDAYRQLRELLATFRLQINQAGLEPALRHAVQELGGAGDLEIDLELRLAECPLSPNEEIHVLQIVREALSNVIHHAVARHVTVSLSCRDGGKVRISVADDGKGLPRHPQRRHHYGLAIMRERARSLGGSLRLLPRSAGGTEVELTFVPIARRAAPIAVDTANHAR